MLRVCRLIIIYGISMDEIMDLGIGEVMKRITKDFENKPIHCSFDVDGIDPDYAHGTGTLVDGGITYREAHYLLRKLAATKNLVGMDLVEINPKLEKTPEYRESFFGDF
jgi:arginase